MTAVGQIQPFDRGRYEGSNGRSRAEGPIMGTDTLWVRATDGTQWSAWSSSFTVSAGGTSMTSDPGHILLH
jgi:hypothetical protein